jgi:hypothetical protein
MNLLGYTGMSKGFFTIAQGDSYVRLAYALALSLKLTQKEYSALSIGVTPGTKLPPKYLEVFDSIIEIPWEDAAKNSKWKLENEWKAIYMSPYDETVKLDADMLFTSDISEWWNILSNSDVVFATEASTYRNEKVDSDYYRKVFTENSLPNVYTAFFYFNKSPIAFELFKLAEHIFNNWVRYFYVFLEAEHRPAFVSTDVVFAIAAKILDIPAQNNRTAISIPTFVHMKTQLQKWHIDRNSLPIPEEWNKVIQVYFNDECELKIGNYQQTRPFHYHVKDFITDDIITTMERKLGYD